MPAGSNRPGMWRVQWSSGELSDLTNLSRAKDALARSAESEERRLRAPAEEAISGPLVRQSGRAATRQARRGRRAA